MATQGNQLYVSIEFQKTIRMYDTTNGNLITHFQASGDTRGLAIDPQGYLRVAMYGKNVDIFTHDGHKVQRITYPQVSSLDGIAMDNETYSILVDRGAREIKIYNYNNLLVNRITGFGNPTDTAMGYKCVYLIVTDYGRGIYML